MDHVTLRDIAASVGVSERLVAYALSGNGRVGARTRQRIIDEARRLGYRPNRAARALVTGRSHLIALCLPATGTAYCDKITRLVLEKARSSAYDVVVTRMEPNPESGDGAIVPSGLGRMDGLLVVEPPRMLTKADASGHERCVVMGVWPGDDPEGCDCLRVDLLPAARDAMRRLANRAPARPAYIGKTALDPRHQAFMETAAERGWTPLVRTVGEHEDLMRWGDRTIYEMGRAEKRAPDALLCSNDEIAVGALRGLRRLGVQTPSGCAVIGCDDIDLAQDLNPPLTTIAQPFEEMVDAAWRLLTSGLEQPGQPMRRERLQAHLVVRESA